MTKITKSRASRMTKAKLVDALLETQNQMDELQTRGGTVVLEKPPLVEVKSLVSYTQFFPRPDREEDDLIVPGHGHTLVPEDMHTDVAFLQAIDKGLISEMYEVESPTLPPTLPEAPRELELDRDNDKELVRQILSGNELGQQYAFMEIPRNEATRRPDVNWMKNRLLPILQRAQWEDDHLHVLPADYRRRLNERIEEIKAM